LVTGPVTELPDAELADPELADPELADPELPGVAPAWWASRVVDSTAVATAEARIALTRTLLLRMG
jgi:hypothetical protein